MVSLKKMEIDNLFRRYLQLKGYVIDELGGARNSVFQAIAKAVFSGEHLVANQTKLRNEVYFYMMENRESFKAFANVTIKPGMTSEEIRNEQKRKITDALKNGNWSTEATIVAASHIYQRIIHVELPLQHKLTFKPDVVSFSPIHLSYHGGQHFNLLQEPEVTPILDDITIENYFHDYLETKNYLVIDIPRSRTSLYEALSMGLVGKRDKQDLLKKDILGYMTKNLALFRNRIIQKIKDQQNRPLGPLIQVERLVQKYVADIVDRKVIDDQLLFYAASKMTNKKFVVERPFESPLVVAADGTNPSETIYFSHCPGNHFNFLAVKSMCTMEDNRSIVAPEPVVCNNLLNFRRLGMLPFVPEPSTNLELRKEYFFMLKNAYLRVRSPITIVVMVPVRNLPYLTLAEAIREIPRHRLNHIKYGVFFDDKNKNCLLTDQSTRLHHTIYAYTLRGVPGVRYMNRMKLLAHLILTPVLLNVNHYARNGIQLHALFAYHPKSIVSILLDYYWPYIKDGIRTDLEKLNSNDKFMICHECSRTCPLSSLVCHFDATKFFNTDYFPEMISMFLDKYDLFGRYRRNLPPPMHVLLRAHRDTGENRIANFFHNMDLYFDGRKLNMYASYLLLHVDGRRIDNYTEQESYYQLLNDPSNILSIYVGVTTNKKFREEYIRKEDSKLIDVLTRSSQVFLLRHRPFNLEYEARQDAKTVLLNVSLSLAARAETGSESPNFRILNKCPEYMNLWSDPNNSTTEKFKEFCETDIPVFNFNQNDTRKFKDDVFTGNYQKIEKLKMFPGTYCEKKFSAQEEY